jgi:hypothetical protein
VVEHRVEHQAEALTQPGQVAPIPERRVHLAIIHHGETIVGGGGVEGQDMDGACQALQAAGAELAQDLQRRLARLLDLIGVRDQDGIALADAGLPGACGAPLPQPARTGRWDMRRVIPDQRLQTLARHLPGRLAVQRLQVRQQPLARFAHRVPFLLPIP